MLPPPPAFALGERARPVYLLAVVHRSITLGVALLSAACGSPDSSGSGAAEAPPRSEGGLQWRPCGEMDCAEVMVPLDRNEPAGERIAIALNRVRRIRGLQSVGPLLFNPGGPGGSGKRFVEALREPLATFPFDVIGFDPRGVGDSAALDCLPPANPVAAHLDGGIPAVLAAFREEHQRCQAAGGRLFEHLSTNAVVADIESIRLALGAEQLNFYGISYGTRLGAQYAQTHPGRVRALVLDSPMPPVANLQQLTRAQLDETQVQHEALLAGCAAGELDCPPNARELFDELLDGAASSLERAALEHRSY